MNLTRTNRLIALAIGLVSVAVITALSVTMLPRVAAQSDADCGVDAFGGLTIGEIAALTVEEAVCGAASVAYDGLIEGLNERIDAQVARGRLTQAQADEFGDWLDDVPTALNPSNLVANWLARVDGMTLDELTKSGRRSALGGFSLLDGFGGDRDKGFGTRGTSADRITPNFCEENPEKCSFREFVPEPTSDDDSALGAAFFSGFQSLGLFETGALPFSLFGDLDDVEVIDCTTDPDECERIDREVPFDAFGAPFGGFGRGGFSLPRDGELPFADGDIAAAVSRVFCEDNADECDFSVIVEELIDDFPPVRQSLTAIAGWVVNDLVAQELITEADAEDINDWLADAPAFIDEVFPFGAFSTLGGFGGFGHSFGDSDEDEGDDD